MTGTASFINELGRWTRLALFFALSAVFLSGAAEAEEPLQRVRLIPQWTPQAQFAGYYVAMEKGFYLAQGVDLEIIRGGPDRPVSDFLASGKAEFGTSFLSTAVMQRANGMPLVNICQIVRRSALMLVVKTSSGIKTAADLNGKKIGLWGGEYQIQPRALINKLGLKVTIVPQSHSLDLFLRGGVDAASAMWYNEYHRLISSGLDPEDITAIRFSELDLNFPEDGLYCLEQTLADKPDLCRRVVQATIEGWNYTFAHPTESLDIVMRFMKQAHVPTNRVHQKWMLERMQDIIAPPDYDGKLGVLKLQDYQTVVQALRQTSIINTEPDFRQFYRNPLDPEASGDKGVKPGRSE